MNSCATGRREIDTIIEGLKARTTALSTSGGAARRASISTGETGAARADARAAIEQVVGRLKKGVRQRPTSGATPEPQAPIEPGVRVTVGALGLEGVVLEVHGKHAEIDMNGKRLRAALRDLRVIGAATCRARAEGARSTSICSLALGIVVGAQRHRLHR